MGFRAPKSKVTLKFAAEEFAGFEVVMRRMTFEDALLFDDGDLRQLRIAVGRNEVPKEQLDDRIRTMHGALSEAIQSWNLEDDEGNELPVAVATIRAQEIDFFWTLVYAWIASMTLSVSDDTKARSSDGKPSEELSIPMEITSESQAS